MSDDSIREAVLKELIEKYSMKLPDEMAWIEKAIDLAIARTRADLLAKMEKKAIEMFTAYSSSFDLANGCYSFPINAWKNLMDSFKSAEAENG